MGSGATEYNSVFGGMPGQTKFYFTAETFFACQGSKERLWRSLQQPLGGREGTYWPTIREYRIIKDGDFQITTAATNPQFGQGGGTMVFIDNYHNFLEPLIYPQNLDGIEPPSDALSAVLEFELRNGNRMEYIDFDGATRRLEGIYMTRPLDIAAINARAFSQVRYFESAENLFCAPEAGYICNLTRQFLTAAR